MNAGSDARRRIISGGAALILAVALTLLPTGENEAAEPKMDSEGLDLTVLEKTRELISDGYFSEAEASAKSLLASLQAAGNENTLEYAEALDCMATAMRRNSKATRPETLSYAKQALALKTSLLGEHRPSVASSLHNLGLLYYTIGQRDEAREKLEAALSIRKSILGSDHPDVAITLITLGDLYFDANGAAQPAMEYFDEARRIQDLVLEPDHRDVAWRLSRIGKMHYRTRDFAEAVRHYKRCLEIRQLILRPGHPFIGASHYNLGISYRAKGEYIGARRHLELALKIREAALGANSPYLASTLQHLASLLHRMGDGENACALYERALAIRRANSGPNHERVVACEKMLADLLKDSGDYARARKLYDHVLSVYEQMGDSRRLQLADVLINYGALLQQIHQFTEAEQVYQRALEIVESGLGRDNALFTRVLHNLATLKYWNGDLEGARESLKDVLLMQERYPASGDATYLLTNLVNLAIAQASLKDEEQSLETALRAERIARDHLRETSRGLEGRLAVNYAASGTRVMHLSVSLAGRNETENPEKLDRVLDAVIRWRALVLDEMVARNLAVKHSEDPHIEALQLELRRARERLARLVVAGSAEGLEQAKQEKALAERAVAEACSQVRPGPDLGQTGLAQVREALPENTALVCYFRYEDFCRPQQGPVVQEERVESRFLAFTLAAGRSEIRATPLGEAIEIERRIQVWRNEIKRGGWAGSLGLSPELNCRQAGEALRERIWDPIFDHLEGARQVLIVPDGDVSLVNFSALPNDDGRYLVETGPAIHYLTAERMVAEYNGIASTGRGLLAIGNPDFDRIRSKPAAPDPQPSSRMNRGGKSGPGFLDAKYRSLYFAPLPQSEQEARFVSSLWGKLGETEPANEAPVLLTGIEATEAAFKKEAPKKRYLHLATHGYFLDRTSTLALAEDTRGVTVVEMTPPDAVITVQAAAENPLLQSGLALAGANNRQTSSPDQEDGVLTAEEIACLDLSGVECAVLSACDTGLGQVQPAEGVFGLRRAFELAGVRTVIMSLWQVEDKSARLWMESFYTARIEGEMSTSEAARSASVSLLRRRKLEGKSTHPFFWAAFVSAGDWR